MSGNESDGLGEAVEQEWRTALLVAAQLTEWIARRAEDRARTEEATGAIGAARAADRYAADREIARAEVTATADPGWWEQADLTAVARVYATAQAWRDVDSRFAAAAADVDAAVEARYGPDVSGALRAAAEHAGGDFGDRSVRWENQQQTLRRAVDADSGVVLAGDSRRDTASDRVAVSTDPGTTPPGMTATGTAAVGVAAEVTSGWDTPARRDAFAAALACHPDAEAVDARVRLDRSRAQPAAAAIYHHTRTVPDSPTRGRGTARSPQIER